MRSAGLESGRFPRTAWTLAGAAKGVAFLRWGSLGLLIVGWSLYFFLPSPDPGPPPGFIATNRDEYITNTSPEDAVAYFEQAAPAFQRLPAKTPGRQSTDSPPQGRR